MIYVTSLARLHETVERTGARHIVTLINADTAVVRPESVPEENHLFLGFNDIIDVMDGMTPPGEHHVDAYIAFLEAWDRSTPLVVHCFAGINCQVAGITLDLSLPSKRSFVENLLTSLRSQPSLSYRTSSSVTNGMTQ